MLSPRYAWAAVVLLLLALVPTASNFYRGLPKLDDRIATTLPNRLAEMEGLPTKRNGKAIQGMFHTTDWVERLYTDDNPGFKIALFVARSYDGKSLFHFPERGLIRRSWTERIYQLRSVEKSQARMKVHSLDLTGVKANTKVLYILLYGKESMGNPYLFLLARLPRMLAGEREPFTLLFAQSDVGKNREKMEQAMESLLLAAVKHISAQNSNAGQ